jgi:hypothetical protein
MPFVPVLGSIAELNMFGSLGALGSNVKNVVNVFHYRLALIVLPPTKTALETAFNAGVGVNFLAAANVRFVQSQTTVRWIDDATDAPQSFARAGVGAIATDPLPTLDSVSMLLRTGKRGRNYRGSKHFAAVNEVDTTGDVLTGAGLARWQTLQTSVFATIVDGLGNNWVPSVLSRSLSQLLVNPTTIIANDVTQVLLNKNIGTMRRRKVQTVR